MAFKAVFIAHAPDADPEKHHNVIETGKYRLYTYVVKTQAEAIKVCKDLYGREKIDSVLLCPGFTHKDVAEIFEALGNKVAVCVSRGDGPSSKITGPVLQKEFS
jgi:Family of unknown function (DUF6506)